MLLPLAAVHKKALARTATFLATATISNLSFFSHSTSRALNAAISALNRAAAAAG